MGNIREELEAVEQKRTELKKQLKEEKEYNKTNKNKVRAERDSAIEETDVKLRAIQKEIFAYNKLGKTKKMDYNILDVVQQLTLKPEQESTEVATEEEVKESGINTKSD